MLWTRLIAGLALAVAIAATPRAPSWAAPDGKLVKLPDGRRIYLNCVGQGAPTVLFEGGYLAESGAWFKVQPQIARITRACAYDRAGYGRSDPGPMPRDGKAVARDLDEALRAARIDGPFVLVAHSAGGLYGQLFADRRPRQVVGMVLADPSVEYQDKRFAAVFGPGAASTEPLRARDAACLEAAEQGKLPSSEPALVGCTPKPRPGQSAAAQAAAMAQALNVARWRTAVSELETL
jgi:pimeloyl-ACP methyl ester carboxylesterase